MNAQDFRVNGVNMIDYVIDYAQNVGKRRVTSNVEPGYLAALVPKDPPNKPEDFNTIMKDVEDKIMPGLTHWQHPHFHAYFSSANSYPGILADMFTGIIGIMGFSWAASPVVTELETIIMDWMAKAFGLPKHFMFTESGGVGGGTLQNSASDCILASMLAARAAAISYIRQQYGDPSDHDSVFLPKLVAYTSKEAHSCVEKAAMIALVQIRILEGDENYSLNGRILQRAIDEDLAKGLFPFFVSATIGTTGCTAVDNIKDIGQVTRRLPACWFHCDCAYGGNAFVCPEFRVEGMEYLDSLNVNPYKWLMINFDGSCHWVKDIKKLTTAFTVDPLYLQHENENVTIDYRHWGIPLSRRFRALRFWFTIRSYGIEGLQKYIRGHVALAKEFEKLVRMDDRFEVVHEVRFSLVCFRLKGSDLLNQELLALINSTGRIHMIPSRLKGVYIIRFAVCTEHATKDDIEYAWREIQHQGTKILEMARTGKKPYTDSAPPLHAKAVRRHSFTKSVPRDVFDRKSRNSLNDEATPLVVPEEEDLELDPGLEELLDGDGVRKAQRELLDADCTKKGQKGMRKNCTCRRQ